MRDNNKRIGAPHLAVDHAAADVVAAADAVVGETKDMGLLSALKNLQVERFSVVKLVSGGRLYPPSHPLHGVESVEMKHPTTKQQDILNTQDFIRDNTVIDKMLASILDPSVSRYLDQMLPGDKSGLVVRSRMLMHGPSFATKVKCPNCRTSNPFEFMMEEGIVATPGLGPGEDTDLDIKVEMKEGHVEYSIPFESLRAQFRESGLDSDARMSFRLLYNQDSLDLAEWDKKNQEAGRKSEAETHFMQKVLVGISGQGEEVRSQNVLYEMIQKMPAPDIKNLKRAYAKVSPRIDLRMDWSCKSCHLVINNHEIDTSIVDFFWSE